MSRDRSPELYAKYCELREQGHRAKDITDLHMLPMLQRETAARFEHSFKAGASMPIPPKASQPGPASLAGRSPKRDRPKTAPKRRCRLCCQRADLDSDGKCVDRLACESAMAPMFGEEEMSDVR